MIKVLEKLGLSLPPLPSTPPTHAPHRATLYQLAFIIGIAVLMHFQIADPAIGLFAVAVFALKAGLLIRGRSAPPRLAMMALTIFSLVLIVFLYGGWNGQRAGISFLVLLVALKFLESRGLRDYFVVCLILYFLAASSFLFNSSILSISIVVLYTLAITSILFQLSDPTPQHWIKPFKSAAMIVLKALPLAILLFFLFPRIQGDFGFLPSQDERTSELADSLVAGDLATSAFNNALAFRVEFDGVIPASPDRYWRVKVMDVEDNFSWRVRSPSVQDFQYAKEMHDKLDLASGRIKYQILHEPSSDLFLPYLDYISGAERGQLLPDYSMVQRAPSGTSFTYSGSSNLNQAIPAPTPLGQPQITSVPSARLMALLSEWRSQAQNEADLVRLVYGYFQQNEFAYSLMPDSLRDDNKIEDFLLNTRVGYCEHYASAFTILMRWLNVPARVVVGYQGGRFNRTGNFLEVRYSDAHAWSEVWIEGRWQRVDPTAAISPERIEYGMDALMELWEEDGFGGLGGGTLTEFLNPGAGTRMMRQMRETWSNISYQWNKWIVDYDFETQKELLGKLGFEGRNSAYVLITLMFAAVSTLMLFYFWRLLPKRIPRSEAQRLYLRFVKQFDTLQVRKLPSETPREFAEKASAAAPAQKMSIAQITAIYENIRYGDASKNSSDQINELKRLVKQFTLR